MCLEVCQQKHIDGDSQTVHMVVKQAAVGTIYIVNEAARVNGLQFNVQSNVSQRYKLTHIYIYIHILSQSAQDAFDHTFFVHVVLLGLVCCLWY